MKTLLKWIWLPLLVVAYLTIVDVVVGLFITDPFERVDMERLVILVTGMLGLMAVLGRILAEGEKW